MMTARRPCDILLLFLSLSVMLFSDGAGAQEQGCTTLSWDPVAGAESYTVEITELGNTSVVFNIATSATNETFCGLDLGVSFEATIFAITNTSFVFVAVEPTTITAGTECTQVVVVGGGFGFDCVCAPGFTGNGTVCDDIDECALNVDNCGIRSLCTNTIGSFICSCNLGFTGDGVTCNDLNECAFGLVCDSNATCANTLGSYICACNTGFVGNGTTCDDIDECALNVDNCGIRSLCTNTIGSFFCSCNLGFTGDGVTCSDINECAAFTPCDVNATCTNSVGSFSCSCNTGFTGDGSSCVVVDLCSVNNGGCDVNATCIDSGSVTCACNAGYSGNGIICIDIDECVAGSDNCASDASCTNTPGSFTCACFIGYTGDGVTCSDFDECTTFPCHANADCSNTFGSFLCSCNSGFTGDGLFCSDIDECAIGPVCDLNATCVNNDGSYSCTCNSGFVGNGTTCADFDECSTSPCDVNANCSNSFGSFLCSCNTGFIGDGLGCLVADLCSVNNGGCDANATCTDSGSVTCTCNTGYSGNGTICIDIDECAIVTPCDANANCSNSVGSFLCSCNTGFIGDGLLCTVADLCSVNNGGCDANATCTDSGSVTCACNTGYSGNGTICIDIDECAFGPICDSNATCTNSDGSYSCTCNPGFVGNGTTCADGCPTLNPCDVNADCLNIGGTLFCSCNTGFTGDGFSCVASVELQFTIKLSSNRTFTVDLRNSSSSRFKALKREVEGAMIAILNTSVPGFFSVMVNSFSNGSIISDLTVLTTNRDVTQESVISAYNNSTGDKSLFDSTGLVAAAAFTTTAAPTMTAAPTTTGMTTAPTATLTTVVDLCSVNNGGCGSNATCIDSGSVICACNTGYSGNGTICIDIDECATSNPCDANANCLNNVGSFLCSCNTGFTGDGLFCTDIDECATSTPCDANANCLNNVGSFLCSCNTGFTGDGLSCTGTPVVDLCSSNNGGCDSKATCIDSGDSVTCACNTGHVGNGTSCVVLAGKCAKRTIDGLTFPETFFGLIAYSEKTCPSRNISLASINCVSNSTSLQSGYFDVSSIVRVDCDETIAGAVSKGEQDIAQVTTSLHNIHVLSSNVETLSPRNVENITQFFDFLQDTDLQLTQENVEDIVEITSHVAEYYEQEGPGIQAEQKQTILQSLSSLPRKLSPNLPGGTFNRLSQGITLQVLDVSDFGSGSPVSFSPQFYSESNTGAVLQPIEIKIPSQVFESALKQLETNSRRKRRQAPTAVRLVSVGYRGSSLFPTDRQTDWIIASEVGDLNTALKGLGFDEPVEIINNVIKEQPLITKLDKFKSEVTQLECSFWDFEKKTWSREGCCLLPEEPPRCLCNHLTNFAVLVNDKVVPSDFSLSIYGYVGCALSALGFLLTLLLILFIKKLRNSKVMQIHAHLCICLAFSFILFISGVQSTATDSGCSVISVFLQFGLLASWCWMAVYSHRLYMSIVKTMETLAMQYRIRYACLFAYGFPFLLVLINSAVTLGHIDKNQATFTCDGDDVHLESSYNARNFCWLRHYSLFFGFLLPVGILLIYNFVVFSIVVVKLTCKKKRVSSDAKETPIVEHLVRAVIIATTMGLSWILGYFMLVSDNDEYLRIMSWLFTIINAIQGIIIFAITCIRNKDVRQVIDEKFFGGQRTGTMTNSSGISSPPQSPTSKNGPTTHQNASFQQDGPI